MELRDDGTVVLNLHEDTGSVSALYVLNHIQGGDQESELVKYIRMQKPSNAEGIHTCNGYGWEVRSTLGSNKPTLEELGLDLVAVVSRMRKDNA